MTGNSDNSLDGMAAVSDDGIVVARYSIMTIISTINAIILTEGSQQALTTICKNQWTGVRLFSSRLFLSWHFTFLGRSAQIRFEIDLYFVKHEHQLFYLVVVDAVIARRLLSYERGLLAGASHLVLDVLLGYVHAATGKERG